MRLPKIFYKTINIFQGNGIVIFALPLKVPPILGVQHWGYISIIPHGFLLTSYVAEYRKSCQDSRQPFGKITLGCFFGRRFIEHNLKFRKVTGLFIHQRATHDRLTGGGIIGGFDCTILQTIVDAVIGRTLLCKPETDAFLPSASWLP